MPLVSVILPTYNRARLLGRAVKSVLNQTFEDFELIIVDDGSTDDTESVIRSFDDERIKYIRHPMRRGVSAARNTGIKASRGRYIAFQDSDDEWLPKKLEKQVDVFENARPDVGVVYTGMWRIRRDKSIKYYPAKEVERKEGHIHDLLISRSLDIATATAMVRRCCFDKVGVFDENLLAFEDYDLWLRISKYYRFKYIDEPLIRAFLQEDSITLNADASVTAMEHIISKYWEDFAKYPKALRKHCVWIGNHLILRGELKRGRRWLLNAVKSDFLNVKNITHVSLIGISFFGYRVCRSIVQAYLRFKSGRL